ncbi:hypothetical protein J4477_01625 [Candidatus Pacearchaeota archaeon]|nr:hypothetical protein [Candidatus Pacearchaeota archaeon]
MDKKTFQKKWYYKLLQVIYFGSLIAFSLFLIIAGILDSDVEIAGFFWAGVLGLVYWLIKRVFYYLMFKEKVFGKNQKGVSIGFVFGVIVALIWLMIMSKMYPEEEIANIVIVSLLISGLIFGFIGYLIQNYFRKNKKN